MKILLNGAAGRLAGAVRESARELGHEIAAGVDIKPVGSADFTVYASLEDVKEKADVIMDCSFHGLVRGLLTYAKRVSTPVVIATTGHSAEELAYIREMSESLPIFMSANMSLGMNVLMELSARVAALLGNSFDIEVVEAHHNKKIDAPSGSAVKLAESINDAVKNAFGEALPLVYDRTQRREARKAEIGVHSIRGGTIVGEHEVIFAGKNERLTLSHSAQSRDVFAEGAVAAAAFMLGKPNGLYSMKELLA